MTVEAVAMARVPLAGSNWIPGINEKKWLLEIFQINKIKVCQKIYLKLQNKKRLNTF